jgi:hypothetical protein
LADPEKEDMVPARMTRKSFFRYLEIVLLNHQSHCDKLNFGSDSSSDIDAAFEREDGTKIRTE